MDMVVNTVGVEGMDELRELLTVGSLATCRRGCRYQTPAELAAVSLKGSNVPLIVAVVDPFGPFVCSHGLS